MPEGHIRQRGERWRVIIDAGRDPLTGRRRQISRTAPTRRAAARLRNELLEEIAKGRHGGSEATVDELFTEFMAGAGPNAPTSRANYRLAYESWLKPQIGAVPVRRLKPAHLNRVYGALRDRGLKPSTIRKAHTVISAMLSYGQDIEWVTDNVARRARPPALERTTVTAIAERDLLAVIARLEAQEATDGRTRPDLALFVLLSAALGTRRGETCGIQWRDIDFAAGQLTIARRVVLVPGGSQPVATREHTKGGRSRTVALDVGVLDRLLARHAEALAAAAMLGGELSRRAFVFSSDGLGERPWRPDYVSHRLRRVRAELGLDDTVHLHAIRHLAATKMLAAGVDVRTAAERLGHSPSMTLEVYGHFVPAADQRAAEILGRGLTPPVPSEES